MSDEPELIGDLLNPPAHHTVTVPAAEWMALIRESNERKEKLLEMLRLVKALRDDHRREMGLMAEVILRETRSATAQTYDAQVAHNRLDQVVRALRSIVELSSVSKPEEMDAERTAKYVRALVEAREVIAIVDQLDSLDQPGTN